MSAIIGGCIAAAAVLLLSGCCCIGYSKYRRNQANRRRWSYGHNQSYPSFMSPNEPVGAQWARDNQYRGVSQQGAKQ
eukprot:32125-Eustigmatos_ZCMA.PRE.1